MSDAASVRRTLRSATEVSFTSTADSSDDVSDTQASKGGNIKVVCRFRPLNERERSMSLGQCVEFPSDPKQVWIHSATEGGGAPLKFAFDYVFPPDSEQAAVYEAAARPTVESVLEGFNGTVFAYGQTGSGKTFTMTGADVDDDRLKGIIPRMITTVFNTISAASDHLEFTVKVGYCEIYMEKIKDLLNPIKNNLKVHEDKSRGVFIADLTEEYVSNDVEVASLMKLGTQNREVGFTLMNEGSSRSHSLFIMTITQNNTMDYSAKTGKLYLVDLAGSEKVGKTGAEGKRLDEAKNINKSLSTLGLVINSLTDGKSTHVPYRDSKLTRVLQDSLGGNSKTALIITASPSPYNEAETISTLRFGIRAKAIKNKPVVNKEYTVAELKLLLSKAEAEISKKVHRIQVLEATLVESGQKLPLEDSMVLDEIEGSTQPLAPPPELAEMHQELEETRSRLSETAESLASMNSKLLVAENKVSDLLHKRELMQEELNRMLNTIHSLEEEKLDLEERNRKLAFMYDNALVQIETLGHMKQALESRIAEQDDEIDRINTLNRRSIVPRGSILVINDQLSLRDGELRELRARLESMELLLTQVSELSTEQTVKNLIAQVLSPDGSGVELKSLYQLEKERNTFLADELAATRAKLEAALRETGQRNQQTPAESAQSESIDALKEQLAAQQASYEATLAQLTEERSNLLEEIESEQINYRQLENAKNEEQRLLKKKVNSLELNLEQLTLHYNKSATKVKLLKTDCESLEKRINSKEAKIEQLRKEVMQLKEGNSEQLSDSDKVHRFFMARAAFGGTKIKKTIKGGKAQKLRVMGMFSPLASLGSVGEARRSDRPPEDSEEAQD